MKKTLKTLLLLCLIALSVGSLAFAETEPCAHEYGPWQPKKAATCTETGLTDGKKCSVCGETLKAQEIIPAKGHAEEIIAGKAATCTETGLTEGKRCSACGVILTAQETIPAMGHQYKTSLIAPTATSKGYTKHTCMVCGDSYKDNWKDKLAVELPMDAPKPTAEPQAGLYGSIVTNLNREAMDYDCRIDTLMDDAQQGEAKDNLLEIVAKAEPDGSYALRNLHLTMEMMEQLNADGIEYVRFVNGDAALLIPLEMFKGEDVTLIAADVAQATGYMITVDPNATTAENVPGFQVQAMLTTLEDDETDVTAFVYGMMLTVGEESVEVTENAVYTFQ